MALQRWDPFREANRVGRVLDRFFEDPRTRPTLIARVDEKYFPVDIYEAEDSVVVKASLPGIKPDEVDLSITGTTLTLRSETKQTDEAKAEDYYRRERHYGAYARSVTLPKDLKSDEADATFDSGVLTIRIPKVEETRPKSIKIKEAKEG